MEVHKPKPWHGWREFLKEYGIIVLGVLTALGAEQAVEAVHWQEKTEAVRKSLTSELSNDRARWEYDVASGPYMLREIAQLERWTKAPSLGSAPSHPAVAEEALFWMHSANWNLATASQTLGHFPMAEQLAYGSLYDGIVHRQSQIDVLTKSLHDINGALNVGPEAGSIRDMRRAMAALKIQIEVLLSDEGYMRRHFDAVGVTPDTSDFKSDARPTFCQS